MNEAVFDFDCVDDLTMLANESSLVAARVALREIGAFSIGALLEFIAWQAQEKRQILNLDDLHPCAPVVAVRAASVRKSALDLCSREAEVEQVPMAVNGLESAGWRAFKRRLVDAAKQTGFSARTAYGFAAAFDELISNVVEHSEATQSALAGYQRSARTFEFAVVDQGIGVFASLQKCRDFDSLADDAEALSLAIKDGVSRHGSTSSRGYGFRQIFLSIAELSGQLRFRSGKCSLEISGILGPETRIRLSQKVNYKGFAACISCRATKGA